MTSRGIDKRYYDIPSSASSYDPADPFTSLNYATLFCVLQSHLTVNSPYKSSNPLYYADPDPVLPVLQGLCRKLGKKLRGGGYGTSLFEGRSIAQIMWAVGKMNVVRPYKIDRADKRDSEPSGPNSPNYTLSSIENSLTRLSSSASNPKCSSFDLTVQLLSILPNILLLRLKSAGNDAQKVFSSPMDISNISWSIATCLGSVFMKRKAQINPNDDYMSENIKAWFKFANKGVTHPFESQQTLSVDKDSDGNKVKVAGVRVAKPQELTITLWSQATVGLRTKEGVRLMGEIARQLDDKPGDFKIQEISNT